MTRRCGSPGLFLAGAVAVGLCASSGWIIGFSPQQDAINNAVQQLVLVFLAWRLQHRQDQDTAQIETALAGLVIANPAVPDELAPHEGDG